MTDTTQSLLITEASALGVSKLASLASLGQTTILEKRNQPIAAVIGYAQLHRYTELERDMLDLALVATRSATDTGVRTSLDDVIEHLGYTRDQIESLPDPAAGA